jgi:Rieske 2Fe-2S family protein
MSGLAEHAGLAAEAYYDAPRYELEMRRIWLRNWVYVCRSIEVAGPRHFRGFELGDQKLLLVRDDAGVLRGFHNTCRHRGAALCAAESGVLRSPALVCPYHAWVYSLQGELLRTSSRRHAEGFDPADYPLYAIHLHEWRGFVFACFAPSPPSFDRSFDLPHSRLDAWPLEGLVVGHELRKEMQCNWKIFWENYNECLHCPGVHPQLSQLVPLYGRGLLEERDDPEWQAHAADPDPKFKGGVRAGAVTWSVDGRATGTLFPEVSSADRQVGHVYLTALPSMFIVGHVDYVRVVRLRPLAAERTELHVQYLFAPSSLADPAFDLDNIVEFTNRVMTEDAGICEVNQRGLHAMPHRRGVVMPEEYEIRNFHRWLDAAIADH